MPESKKNNLTIDTEISDVPSNDDNSTPTKRRSWTLQGTPTGKSGRTWLQSPRKWSGKTPTNKDDGLTPNSSKKNTYYTYNEKNKDEMFGTEEDITNSSSPSADSKNNDALFASLVHQVDRSGQPVNTSLKRNSNDMDIETISRDNDRESRSSVWGLFTGKIFGQNEERQGEQGGQRGQQQEQGTGSGTTNTGTPRSSLTTTAATKTNTTSGNRRSLKASLRLNGISQAQQESGKATKDNSEITPRTGRSIPRTGRNSENNTPRSVSPRSSPYRSFAQGLLGDCSFEDRGRKCLILDLDETLVHSSFKPIDYADFIIPVSIEGNVTHVFVTKRPGVDEFMRRVGEKYEVVIFTASLPQYANPLLDKLDIHNVIKKRLFRSDCTYHNGNYVKDLSRIDRPIDQTIIVDNSPLSYLFQPENAIGCTSFFDDPRDTELKLIGDFLIDILDVPDVRDHLSYWETGCKNKYAPVSSPRTPRLVTGA